jgi:adenine-specific DNA methylase
VQSRAITIEEWASNKEKIWAEKYMIEKNYVLNHLKPDDNPYSYLYSCLHGTTEMKNLGHLRQVYTSYIDYIRLQIIKNPSDYETNKKHLTVLCSELEDLLDVMGNVDNLDRRRIHESLFNAVEALNSERTSDLLSELYLINLQLQDISDQPKTVLTAMDLP